MPSFRKIIQNNHFEKKIRIDIYDIISKCLFWVFFGMKEWITLEIYHRINNLMEKRLRPGNLYLGEGVSCQRAHMLFPKIKVKYMTTW